VILHVDVILHVKAGLRASMPQITITTHLDVVATVHLVPCRNMQTKPTRKCHMPGLFPTLVELENRIIEHSVNFTAVNFACFLEQVLSRSVLSFYTSLVEECFVVLSPQVVLIVDNITGVF
jgi:hypothetical protein